MYTIPERRLRELWADGTLSMSQIGKRLGVSKDSANKKAHRLGLASRESPIKPSGKPAPAKRLRGSSTLPPLASLS